MGPRQMPQSERGNSVIKSLFFVSAALFAATAMASDPGAPSTLSMQDRAAVVHEIDQGQIVEAIGSGATSGGRSGSGTGTGGGRKGGGR